MLSRKYFANCPPDNYDSNKCKHMQSTQKFVYLKCFYFFFFNFLSVTFSRKIINFKETQKYFKWAQYYTVWIESANSAIAIKKKPK